MAVFIDQDIFGLQVSVYDIFLMNKLESEDDLTEIKPGAFFTEIHFVSEKREKIASFNERHCEKELVFVLEGILKRDQERMAHHF